MKPKKIGKTGEIICRACGTVKITALSEIKRGAAFCNRSCKMTFMQKSGGWNRKTGTMRHRGYVLEWAPLHPDNVKGYVPQHRLVAERALGRRLSPEEDVHHKNHVKDDNSPENLQVLSKIEHLKLHGFERAHIVIIDGIKYPFCRACKIIGVSYGSAKRKKRLNKLTHQETIDFYLVDEASKRRRGSAREKICRSN